MSEPVWMTYKQLADALGIGVPGARHKAKRRKWTTEKGNHPNDPVRVLVPYEFVSQERSPDRSGTDHLLNGAARSHTRPPDRSLDHAATDRPLETRQIVADSSESVPASAHRQVVETLQAQIVQIRADHDRHHREALEFWKERCDSAECRAEQSAAALNDLVTRILTTIPPPATTWWERLFGVSRRSDIRGA